MKGIFVVQQNHPALELHYGMSLVHKEITPLNACPDVMNEN